MALEIRTLSEVFAQVPDPRDPRGVRHPLKGILTLVFLGPLARIRGPQPTSPPRESWTGSLPRSTKCEPGGSREASSRWSREQILASHKGLAYRGGERDSRLRLDGCVRKLYRILRHLRSR